MTNFSVEIPRDALLQAVKGLDEQALEQFVDDVLKVKAQRRAPSIGKEEAELLQKISRTSLSLTEAARLQQLIAKAEGELLTSAENLEQQQLAEKSELLYAARVKLIAELAIFREQALDTTMEQLGLLNIYG